MRVCFSVGQASSALINQISKSADNVEFSTYPTIRNMIKESTMRHIFYDRIVFSEKILTNPEVELQELNKYITEHSDNTKIVCICQGKDLLVPNIFNRLFDSPMYTVVLAEKVTNSILLEFVKGDITQLKTKYYSLDVKEAKAVTSKYAEGGTAKKGKSKKDKQEKTKKKGGFNPLSMFFTKNKRNLANQNSIEDVPSNEGNTGNLPSQNSDEQVQEMSIPSTSIGMELGEIGTYSKSDEKEFNTFSNNGLSDSQPISYNDDIDLNNCEEDFLGIGGFGEQHIDTGFLDEEAELEIDNALKGYNEDSLGLFDNVDIVNNEVNNDIKNPYRLVIGERGAGVTSYIVNYSISQASKGKKVLIVDLDTVKNGILSYIGSDNFYSSGCSNGIHNIRVYSEDNISILSNGYGMGINEWGIDNLLNSSLLSNYDIVFFDCPIDCISHLSKSLVDSCFSMIKVEGNKGSLLGVLSMLTRRDMISAEVEDILFEKSKFDIENKSEFFMKDLSFMRNLCFFSRGDWLSKIS